MVVLKKLRACAPFNGPKIVLTNARDQAFTSEYILLKHQVAELTKQTADWRRKLEVAQLKQAVHS